ncbi:DUF2809 domain-containing protein [Flavisolibacter ginsenosidimutans]|uniref:DUF2809 domain-containing protein n=1 Tax=Flavisolibacter ginsenosidimutans TaxID=661481 RepID=A0A5B8UGN7_9BACT|nr:DUF2809 domain-containing protein [Flavisolibacter ginsenosidimutans]QEC55562.1 DUF2809 domain-containing protein [Flavisolibacter ginsenosidimutans]
MLTFRPGYFLLTFLLFVVEVSIALFAHDRFVRPYAGDFLVVILLYCFGKSFLKIPALPLAMTVLLFAYAIETAQYFHLVNRLGFQNHNIIRIILGSSFEWGDMLAYTLGIVFVLLVEQKLLSNLQP